MTDKPALYRSLNEQFRERVAAARPAVEQAHAQGILVDEVIKAVRTWNLEFLRALQGFLTDVLPDEADKVQALFDTARDLSDMEGTLRLRRTTAAEWDEHFREFAGFARDLTALVAHIQK